MHDYLLFALIGLGSGAMYAGIGLGLVVIYKGTGAIHFGLTAVAGYVVIAVDEMKTKGDLVLPIIGIPNRIQLGQNLSNAEVLGIALGLALVLGALTELLVFHPLRRAPVLATVVATVGVLVSMQALEDLNFNVANRTGQQLLPSQPAHFLGITLPRDRLWITLVVVVVNVGCWAWFRFTRTGLAVRAAAENERAASLAKWSPRSLAALTVIGATVLVSALLVLGAPIQGSITSTDFVYLIVPGLAAALVGRLTSLGTTLTAGLVLGMFQSETLFLKSKSWFPSWGKVGIEDALPFVVIIIALVVAGRSLPRRGATENDRLPAVLIPRNRPLVIAGGSAAALAGLLLTSGSWRFAIVSSLSFSLVALSLVVLTGMVGQVSLAQAAFAGTSGFLLAKIGHGLPFPLSLLAAATVTAFVGLLVGLPALRIRGAQLAVVTIAAAVAVEQFVFNNPSLTNPSGDFVPSPSLFGIDLGTRAGRNFARIQFAILVLVVVVGCAVLVGNLIRGQTGRRLLAIRSNERAAASLGINVSAAKLTAFAISSFLAGLGGALLAYSRGEISSASYDVFAGLSFLVFAYLGGITSVTGAFTAGLFAPLGVTFVIANQYLNLSQYWDLLAGALVVLTAIQNPSGIAGRIADLRQHLKSRSVLTANTPPPPPPVAPWPTAPGRLAKGNAFDTKELSVTFGGIRALDGVSVSVRPGQILGLIGPNGAGKTTFIDAATGFVPAHGTVLVSGEPVRSTAPHRLVAAGVARTWQSIDLFDDLTVRANLLVGAERAGTRSLLLDLIFPGRASHEQAVDQVLLRLGMLDMADHLPEQLSLGQRKLVGVARALMLQPTVLLLDEPAAGLDTAESAQLGRHLRSIADTGMAIVLVDHDMELVLDLCDELVVLELGRVLAAGTPAAVRRDAAVIAAYLGSPTAQTEDAR